MGILSQVGAGRLFAAPEGILHIALSDSRIANIPAARLFTVNSFS